MLGEKRRVSKQSRRITAQILFLLYLTLSQGQAVADPWGYLDTAELELRSAAVSVADDQGRRIVARNARTVRPIASITKLMTAIVVLKSGVDLNEEVTITDADRDRLRHSRSRIRIGRARLPRRKLLLIALMSSANRAAAALGRTTFPGGTAAFVEAMNQEARRIGMSDSQFVDTTGLDAGNQASADDLVRLVREAGRYPLIREYTTTSEAFVRPYADAGDMGFRNTNPLVNNGLWQLELSKTGYINESGRCLVMQVQMHGRRLYVVLLGSVGRLTPVGDSNRLRKWITAELGL